MHQRKEKNEQDPSIEAVSSSSSSIADARKKDADMTRKLFGVAFLMLAILGLYELDFVNQCLYSPRVSRVYMNAGIFFSTLVAAFGSYIELYRALFLQEKVTYQTAKHSTHAMLFSLIAASICFNIALWPLWGWKAPLYLIMWSWGVLFQILVVFPPSIQRFVFGGIYLWFMHTYFSPYMI